MEPRAIDRLELEDRRVLIRCDFNVPLTPEGEVADDTRIVAALPTIRHCLNRDARVVLMSHLGRPKGQFDPKLSLEPVGLKLAELLDREILLTDDCVGDGARKVVRDLRAGQVALLENLRFHAEEKKNEESFARKLAAHGEVFLQEAFGTLHRAHASVAGVPRFIQDKGAGFLVRKELEFLGRALDEPKRPFVAILGGAKVSDKIGVIEALQAKANAILIGGAMAYTFLLARGEPVGDSLVERDKVELAERLLKGAAARGVNLVLPTDHVVATEATDEAETRVESDGVPDGFKGLDIGPRTVAAFKAEVDAARTVFWNGPMGLFEKKPFSEGTFALARLLAESKAVSVVGGGDSASAVRQAGVADRVTHISTGGGASLEFVQGKALPGLTALVD